MEVDGFSSDRRACAAWMLAALLLPRELASLGAGSLAHDEDDDDDEVEDELGFEALALKLRDERPDARRRAVRDLAALDTREAWTLVIGALADLEPEVADEAQMQLGTLRDARLLDDLCGNAGLRAKDDWVRRRVAEALGRACVPIEAEPLLDVVMRTAPEHSRLALWSIERLARADRLAGDTGRTRRALERIFRERHDDEVHALALCALCAVDVGAARPLVREAARSRDAVLRSAAVELALELEPAEALALARTAAGDEDPAVRAKAVETLVACGDRDAFGVLVERLELEERPRVQFRVLEHLQRASGMKHRLDARPWRLWLAQLPPDWRAGRAAPAPESHDRSVAFAGLPIVSDRLCFLIDFSGSLWNERDEGGTRKDVVDQRMNEVLPALREGTLFNLVPYTAEPLPWADALVPNTQQKIAEALHWFEACRARGKGNFFDAVLVALRDPRVDTIVAVTDGAPTGGRHWNLDLMFPLLLLRTRFRPVAFDSIVIDARPRLQRQWSAFAAASGGRSIAIEM